MKKLNELVDCIEAVLMLIVMGAIIWAGIAIAEGVINALTITVMAVALFFGTAILIDMNWRER